MLQRRQIVALLQNAAAHPDGLLICPETSDRLGSLPVHCNSGHSGQPNFAPAEHRNRAVLLSLCSPGKQRHLQLLDGITVIMTYQFQFHNMPFRYGLNRLSWESVVEGP